MIGALSVSRFAGTVETPRFRLLSVTLRPSSRHKRCTRFAVDLPALATQRGVRTAVGPPRPLPEDLRQPATQRPVISSDARLTALG
jgi:hypothetical protein